MANDEPRRIYAFTHRDSAFDPCSLQLRRSRRVQPSASAPGSVSHPDPGADEAQSLEIARAFP